ncbi:MAG: hypothetical protein ABJF10_07410 [Chthoniobacter sp.]
MRLLQTDEELAAFLREGFRTRSLCRIYEDVLIACFSPDGKSSSGNRIRIFAEQHGWQVEVHSPGNQGIVADFTDGVVQSRELEFH